MNKEVEEFLTNLDEEQFDALVEVIEEVIKEDVWGGDDDNNAA